MPFFLDTQETSQRFSNHIAEFCSLLDTNHIRHGSPNDLFEFAKILESSNQFRFDLSALVKSVAHREGDELLLTDMMGIIVAAVGGPTATNTTADLTKPSNILMEFLLGTGCWRKFGSPSFAISEAPPITPYRPITHSPPPSPPVTTPITPPVTPGITPSIAPPTPTPSVAPEPKPTVKIEEPPTAKSEPPAAPAAAPVIPVAPVPAVAASTPTASTPTAAEPVAPVPIAPALISPPPIAPAPIAPAANDSTETRASLLDASSELRQTLTRLEINTLQVKLHLESIEQRINRIEPPPVLPTVAPEPEPIPVASARPAAVSPAPIPPAPVALPPVPPPPVESPSAVRSGAVDSGSGRLSLFGADVGPAAPADLPNRGRAVFSRPIQQAEPRPNRDLDSDYDLDDLSSPTFAFASEKGRNMVPFGVGLILLLVLLGAFLFARSRGYFGNGGSANVSNTAAAPEAAPPAGSASSPASGSPAAPMTGTSSPPPASGSERANASSSAASESNNSKFKYVSPSIMAGNLLSAPRPEYPASARAAHIAGTVVLQATISRAGSVRTLHAIKGPPALRQAAVDAVRSWRYKPYTVEGRPVDVATTVYVEFTLGPPPAIAH